MEEDDDDDDNDDDIAFASMEPATQHASLMMKVLVENFLLKKTEDSPVSFLPRKHIWFSDTLFELINIHKTIKTKFPSSSVGSVPSQKPEFYHFKEDHHCILSWILSKLGTDYKAATEWNLTTMKTFNLWENNEAYRSRIE